MTPITYLFDDFRLDRSARELRRGGVSVTVPTRVFDCLVYLIENRDRAVGRDELVAALWGRVDVSDAQLGQIVLRARRAIGDDGNDQRYIRTMPKFGYRWLIDVRTIASPPTDTASNDTDDAPREYAAVAVPASVHRSNRRWLVAALVAALLCIATYIGFVHERTPSAPATAAQGPGAIVRPLDVGATPPQDWLRLGGMDALAARLRAGGLRVPPSEGVLAALHASGSAADADDRLRRATDADLIVDGRVDATAQGWHVALSAHPARGDIVRVDADGREALQALRSAADRLLMHFGRVAPDDGSTDRSLDETLQRANAAMLANQLEVARTILLGAPTSAQAEPQLRYRLAQVDFRAGDLAAVEKVLSSLLEDKPGAKDPALRAGALTGLGTVHINRGEYAQAERDFSAAIAEVENWQRPLELGQAFGGRGAARAAQGHYTEALQDLSRARIELQQAGDTLGHARLDMVEGELELQRGRTDAAQPVLERAALTFERFDAVNEHQHTLSMLLACRERALDHAGALALSERAWTARARVRDPQLRGQMVVDRADVLLALGRMAEATALLDEAAREAAPRNPEFPLRVAQLRVQLAAATSRWDEAVSIATQALAAPPSPDVEPLRASLAAIQVRALLALHRRADAQRVAASIGGDATTDARTRALSALAGAMVVADGGNEDETLAAFRTAFERADAGGFADDLVVVAVAFGRWLLAHDRDADAQLAIGRITVWADRDFRCALLQLELFHHLRAPAPWFQALNQAERLAGERTIAPELRQPPTL